MEKTKVQLLRGSLATFGVKLDKYYGTHWRWERLIDTFFSLATLAKRMVSSYTTG